MKVELAGNETRGMTVVKWSNIIAPNSVEIVERVDMMQVNELLLSSTKNDFDSAKQPSVNYTEISVNTEKHESSE